MINYAGVGDVAKKFVGHGGIISEARAQNGEFVRAGLKFDGQHHQPNVFPSSGHII
jgi:hypothetical protein